MLGNVDIDMKILFRNNLLTPQKAETEQEMVGNRLMEAEILHGQRRVGTTDSKLIGTYGPRPRNPSPKALGEDRSKCSTNIKGE